MFDSFARAFSLTPEEQEPRAPFSDPLLMAARGYEELMGRYAGCTFESGLYRLLDAASGPKALELANAFYPAGGSRFSPFAMDWLGRMFALDRGRLVDGDPQVMLLEIGSGDAFEVPCGLVSFHDDELVAHPEEALEAGLFRAWCEHEPSSVPLTADTCVGYKLPLFLNGENALDNLELSDWEVYWTIVGQLKLKTARLPEGTPIRGVRSG